MAARSAASSLALCALLALCLVPHAVSRTNPGAAAAAAAALELEGSSSSVSLSSEHVHGFPCDNVVVLHIPHDGICDPDRCCGLCVEQYMWKYPGIKAVVGDCAGENPHECVCSFLC
uniref:Uncharacterized protein n=1 Tax=Avena sativa TaxID=4498 RepID=A0ACD5XSL2_AVESA